MRSLLLVVAATLALTACGEPEVDVVLPEREDGQHVADLAEILDDEVAATVALVEEMEDLDIAVLTYETPQASCGEAFRAGNELVDAWDADVAVVLVARPGDFTSTDDNRERCLGVQPRDDDLVDGDLREQIAEEIVPPLAAGNDWDGAVLAAVSAMTGGS